MKIYKTFHNRYADYNVVFRSNLINLYETQNLPIQEKIFKMSTEYLHI